MLRVLVDVRRDVQDPAGSQSRREKIESVRPDNAAMLVLTGATRRGRVFVRAALRPRVREKDADLVEAWLGRQMCLQEGDGVDAADLDVGSVRLGQLQQSCRHSRPVHFYPDESRVWSRRGHAGETLAVAKPNIKDTRPGTFEGQCLVPGHVDAVARPQIAERGLLPPRALALPS